MYPARAGRGAVLNGQTRTGGVWSAEERKHHINYLELLAAFLALQAFGKNWTNTTILLRLDNVTAVTYINQKVGTTSALLCQLAITVWTWCMSRNVTLTAEHLPGHLNTIADQESRLVRDRCDWMLNPSVFQRIREKLGPLEVDLFASHLTKQLPLFYSWKADPEAAATDAFMQDWSHYSWKADPEAAATDAFMQDWSHYSWKADPEAAATDAFMQDWSQQRGNANPPWCLIHRCLTKVKIQSARLVLITPLWKTQSWFPIVLEVLEDYPLILPTLSDLVVTPVGQDFLMKQGVPQLIAWPISGNPTHHRVFLQRLQALCSPHGETRLTPATAHPLLNGLAGVTSGVEIPFQDL